MKKHKLKNIPKHIGLIIDGNGRWAQRKGLDRSLGHKAGIDALKDVVKEAYDLGIEVVSIYGFSSENWNRPQDEVDYLFNLFYEYIKESIKEYDDQNIRLNIMGDYTAFPDYLKEEIEKALKLTEKHNKFVVNLGLNYGSRPEILRAVNSIMQNHKGPVDKAVFESYLYTTGLPDPDFIIRTSGEQRLSNFMLWQNAYAELYFPKTYWPDFNVRKLHKALKVYEKRNRRFGAIK